MATIDPGRDLSLIEWIEAQARKPREIVTIIPQHSPILADYGLGLKSRIYGRFIVRRFPRSPDMAQMIEDIANAQP